MNKFYWIALHLFFSRGISSCHLSLRSSLLTSSPYLIMLLIVVTLSGCRVQTQDQAKKTVNNRARLDNQTTTNRDPQMTSTQTVRVYQDGGNQQLTTLNAATDPDGDDVYYSLISPPSRGTLTQCLGLNGSVHTADLVCFYRPQNGVVGLGIDSFTYAAYDRKGGSSLATVIINVIVNSPPTANNLTVSVLENGGTQTLGTLSPAVDVDGDELQYFVSSFPLKGSISNCMGLNQTAATDLVCDYTPANNQFGGDVVRYQAADPRGGVGTGTITITIQSTNQNPQTSTNPATASVNYNLGFQSIDLTTLLTISDPDGTPPDQLTYQVTTPPSRGVLRECLGLAQSALPAPDFNCQYSPRDPTLGTSTDSFYFTVSDQHGGSVVVQVNIDIENETPLPETSTKFLTEDNLTSTFSFTINDLGEGDLVSVRGISPLNASSVFDGYLAKGRLTDCMGLTSSTSTDTVCNYIPEEHATGDDTFIYQVTDLGGKTATGAITLNLSAVDDFPIVEDQEFTFYENDGSTYSFTLSPALEPDGDSLTYALLGNPSTGVGTLANCMGLNGSSVSDLSCDYLPLTSTNGSPAATFIYSASDSTPNTSTATISINLTSTNITPYFTAGSFTYSSVAEQPNPSAVTTSITFPSAYDFDGDALTYAVDFFAPYIPKGSLTNCMANNADLTCDYNPPDNVCGTPADMFVYRATDPEGAQASMLAMINITCNNAVPVITSSSFTLNDYYFQQVLGPLPAASDSDGPPNDTLTYHLTRPPVNGTLSECLGIGSSSNQDLTCFYQISNRNNCDLVDNDFDYFEYQVRDGQGGVATSTISITVNAVRNTYADLYSDHPLLEGIQASIQPSSSSSTNFNLYTTINTGLYGLPFVVQEGENCYEKLYGTQVFVTSSNLTLFPLSSISVYYGTDRSAAFAAGSLGSGGSWLSLADGTAGASDKVLYLDFRPTAGQTGTSTISLALRDDNLPSLVSTAYFTINVTNTISQHMGWTHIVAQGEKVYRDGVREGDQVIAFNWNQFTISSTPSSPAKSIVGYNVYRSNISSSTTSFDFGDPKNEEIINLSSRSFLDEDLDVVSSESQGHVFWYIVLPVLNDGSQPLPTQSYNVLRVLLPPQNKSLVHRWAVNYDMCMRLGLTSLPAEGNICNNYLGPGGSDIAGRKYFNIDRDLIVDRFEMGCKFTQDVCSGSDCISASTSTNPGVTPSAYPTNGAFFYNRYHNECYTSTSAGTWYSLHGLYTGSLTTHTASHLGPFNSEWANYPELPPLTHLTQLAANNLCTSTSFKISFATASSFLTLSTSTQFAGRLPTRKEQVAMMGGGAVNNGITYGSFFGTNRSECNSGYDDLGVRYFDDYRDYEDSFPSLESTSSHSPFPRILKTGSVATSDCQSQFGMQDLIGNVREWTSERFYCLTAYNCKGVHVQEPTSSSYSLNGTTDLLSNYDFTTYHFDGVMGPGGGTNLLDSWAFRDGKYSSTYFFVPMGLPALNNTNLTLASSAGSFMSDDRLSINSTSAATYTPVANLLGLTYGGSFNMTETTGGVYTFDLINAYDTTDHETGFRCVTPVENP